MNSVREFDEPCCYQIRVKTNLNIQWADWFDEFEIIPQEDDETLLVGTVMDQAALHGLIGRIRDLGIPLVSLQRLQHENCQYADQGDHCVILDGHIRPFDMRRDMNAMGELIETAFAGELAQWGINFKDQLKIAQKMVPLLRLLERLSETFRHTFDGFVWDYGGRIISLVNIQKMGLDRTHWQIGNVATHPDFQRRGLARQLVTRAIKHAQTHGARICTLEVRAEAVKAYALYRNLGFIQFDSITELKLESFHKVSIQPIDGFKIRPMKLGEWKVRYALAKRAVPQEVQAFLPLSEAEYRIAFLEKLLEPLAMRMQRVKYYRWGVEKDGELVGYMSLAVQRAPYMPHQLTLRIDPAYQLEIAEPLLTLALNKLPKIPKQMLRISARTSDTHLLELLDRYGFARVDITHRLGKKLTPEAKKVILPQTL